MQNIKVSLFASAVRPKIWSACLDSLKTTTVSFEVVFAGPCTQEDINFILNEYRCFRYIETGNIKPAQAYEIARRHCKGETIVWIADDCEFVGNILGRAYKFWKAKGNEKLILSLQTKESGYLNPKGSFFEMSDHRFYSCVLHSPLMAPIAMMSRKFLDELGGLDRRYICGQYENDIVMRAYEQGAKVEIFGSPEFYVDIDHLRKSILLGESKDEDSFLERPFAKGYHKDRQVLEDSWSYFDPVRAYQRLERGEKPRILRDVSPMQLDKFEPYTGTLQELLTKSESNNLKELWV